MITVVVFNSSMACFNDSRWLSITEAKAAKTSQKSKTGQHTPKITEIAEQPETVIIAGQLAKDTMFELCK